jgi:hypothetical protein
MNKPKELTVIDVKEKQFECGGRMFYIQDSLSFNRYRELQRLSIEFGFSMSFIDLFKEVKKAYDLVQTNKNWGDLAVTLYNIIAGVSKLEDKDDPALRLCALFINEADEDVTVFDELKIKDKINCWSKELDVSPFFHMAVNLVEGWMPAYKVTSQSILNKESKPERETSIKS